MGTLSFVNLWKEKCALVAYYPSSPIYAAILSSLNEQTDKSSIQLNGNQPHLKPIRIKDQDLSLLLQCFPEKRDITSLTLSYNGITDEGANMIAEFIKDVKCSLIHLDISYNDITPVGIHKIAEALQLNTSLSSIILDGNQLERKGGIEMASMLQVNTALTHLSLENTHLHTDCIIAMATVLHGNQTLQSVNLSRPLLHSCLEESTIHISKMLKVNITLKELHLSKHGMTDTGVKWISFCLKENPISSLTHLDLSCNKLSRDGASHIADYLKINPMLEVLDLSCNRIESEGLLSLSKVLLSENSMLKSLLVCFNDIHDPGLLSIAETLHANSALCQLHIWGNVWTTPTCDAFRELIETGRLQPEDTDVQYYQVDGVNLLARTLQKAL